MLFTRHLLRATVFGLALQMVACSPALDWREVRVVQTPLHLLMSCRPHSQDRKIALAGQQIPWRLLVCSTAEHTFGVAWADLGSPSLVTQALTELLAAAASNLAAPPGEAKPLQLTGATPNPGNQLVLLKGRRHDGQPMQMQVALFTYGTAVFQVSVLGPVLLAEHTEPLLDSLRFQP